MAAAQVCPSCIIGGPGHRRGRLLTGNCPALVQVPGQAHATRRLASGGSGQALAAGRRRLSDSSGVASWVVRSWTVSTVCWLGSWRARQEVVRVPTLQQVLAARGDTATTTRSVSSWVSLAARMHTDGPLPTHCEPLDAPVPNLLYPQQRNPVRRRCSAGTVTATIPTRPRWDRPCFLMP
jgi:hypothetical protein